MAGRAPPGVQDASDGDSSLSDYAGDFSDLNDVLARFNLSDNHRQKQLQEKAAAKQRVASPVEVEFSNGTGAVAVNGSAEEATRDENYRPLEMTYVCAAPPGFSVLMTVRSNGTSGKSVEHMPAPTRPKPNIAERKVGSGPSCGRCVFTGTLAGAGTEATSEAFLFARVRAQS